MTAISLQNFIEKRYGLIISGIQLILNSCSAVYVIETSNSKFILKIYNQSTTKLEEIQGETELLKILHQNGAAVAYPITDLRRRVIQKIFLEPDVRYAVLFSYAPGKSYYILSETQIAAVGRQIASIHKITAGLNLKHPKKIVNLDSQLLYPMKSLGIHFKQMEEDYKYLERTTENVLQKVKQIDLSKLSFGYCHFDLLPHNYHFQKNDNVTFFDFELSAQGYLINDAISFYAHYFLLFFFGKITLDESRLALDIFIKNYTQIRAISNEDMFVLPYLGFAFWIFHLYLDFEHYNDRSHPNYLDQQMAIIKLWIKIYLPMLS